MTEIDVEIVNEFLVESHENLDQLDRDFVELEKDPRNREMLARIFRTIHTIKGTSGFLGLGKLEKLTHVGESLLSRLRDGALLLDPDITTALLQMVDVVRQILANIEQIQAEGDGDYTDLIATLTRLQDPAARAAAATTAASAPPPMAVAPPDLPTAPEPPAAAPVAVTAATEAPPPPAAPVRPTTPPLTLVVPAPAASTAQTPPPAPAAAAPTDGGETKAAAHGVSDSSIRVDVGLLDKLMNLVGELVLARNQVLQFTSTQQDSSFVATTQRLNLITTELQESVMKTRMQPIGNVWSKFPRVVRDLSVMCGKKVRIEMEGQDTEIDKTILEAIKDPLTHVVRNSIDHGIEDPARRAGAGKPAEGVLFMRAFHEGGQVIIEISDDGGGIDPEKIRSKALARGLLTAEQAGRIGDREAVNLVFLPGFSTAEKVTNVSGRGVGMDVVRTNIEKIGGTVDIQSKHGEGTTIRIKIPLTLAIIPALVVTAGGDRYAIPQVSLVELVRLDGDQVAKGIEHIHGAPVYRLRGSLLPLIDLEKELAIERAQTVRDAVNIVVLQADDRTFGLVVESINDTEEIVVKPLGKQLKGINCFAGATIMGDGTVALILDVLGIAQRAQVVTEVKDRALGEANAVHATRDDDAQTLLLLGLGDTGRMAVPLSQVARLEEFPVSAVERAGGAEVVQYRGEILPLIRLADHLAYSSAGADPMQVVVYTEAGRSVGLVVDRILDIVEERIASMRAASRPGLLGSAVIQNKVTDLIDVGSVVRSADPSFLEEHTRHAEAA
ncbi:MAG: chemotaxis protein CheW [Deltaproteobacteria bacterium]|nr:chemotaxis protein CheW [Deltaproteobacteria bacterium]